MTRQKQSKNTLPYHTKNTLPPMIFVSLNRMTIEIIMITN